MTDHLKLLPEEATFIKLLDDQYDWPDFYQFKFICSLENKDNFIKLIEAIDGVEKLEINPSVKKHYFSVHFRMYVEEASLIIYTYKSLSVIDGIIKI